MSALPFDHHSKDNHTHHENESEVSYISQVSAAGLAIEAIKQIKLAMMSSVAHSGLIKLPLEVLTYSGSILNLKRWSLLLRDDDIKELTQKKHNTEFRLIDTSANNVPGMFSYFWVLSTRPSSYVKVNIVGATEITDYGLSLLVRTHTLIKELNISKCTSVTDTGLREVGLHLKLLELLNISDTGVTGAGLIQIAEGCPHLTSLNISRCTNLQKYGVIKVFYNCHKLEYINVSHMNEIGDNEIRILALNSVHLTTLVANDAPYISDQSLILLAQNCRSLEYLDVSRKQLQFKITDATLLALKECSPLLRVLFLAGCDYITDVGLTWLAEGCRYLEEIDVSGCTKLMDAGMRSLSQCHLLTHVNVKGNRSISDIGIASLAVGCPKLSQLYCDGLFLLADPRILPVASKKKVGEKASNNCQTSIGVSALAQFAPDITTLHLAGCFQLNTAIQKYISGLSKLIELNLSGCSKVSTAAVVTLVQKCTLLENLNLSDCGDNVNNLAVEAIGINSKNLRILNLSRCGKFSSIRILCYNCLLLKHLYLAECTSLSDDSMMALCEDRSLPQLSHLYITGNYQLTDQIVTWMALGCRNILLLALKGTNIRNFTLRSVLGSFPSSVLVQNKNFFGFWPVQRFEDKLLHRSYSKMVSGILRFQAIIRAIQTRLNFRSILEKRMRLSSALIIQCMVRCYWARREYKRLLAIAISKQNSVVLITSIFHVAKAKKKLKLLRGKAYLKFTIVMATKIQTQWRVFLDRRNFMKLLDDLREHSLLRRHMAIKMQCFVRQRCARNRVYKIKFRIRARINLRLEKSVMIQKVFRGFTVRKYQLELKLERRRLLELQNKSIVKVQKLVRLRKMAKIIRARYAIKVRYFQAAAKIQAMIRGYIARLFCIELSAAELLERENLSALVIQGMWKIKKAYILVAKLRSARDVRMQQYIWAGTEMARFYRGRQARKLLKAMKEEAREYEKWRKTLIQWSATKIQAWYRGIKGRERFKKELREKRGLWVELFDEEKQKRFFFSKLTGEIRWQMPADLLALIPRPICDNCNYYEAYNECAHCQEMFCQQCFAQVHYGGRRKEHEFRCLYDYYNTRIDYRDDEFPSKWPSEMIQDEIQGWMLRVAPIRSPTSVIGSWEIYDAEVAAGDGTVDIQRFYFNRETFEATYNVPYELQEGQYYDKSLQLEYNQQQNVAEISGQDYETPLAISEGDQSYQEIGEWKSSSASAGNQFIIEEGSEEDSNSSW